MTYFKVSFWRDAVERAIKTAAQSAILVFGADQLDVFAADWGDAFGFAAGGAVLSLLTSIASRRIGEPDTASVA